MSTTIESRRFGRGAKSAAFAFVGGLLGFALASSGKSDEPSKPTVEAPAVLPRCAPVQHQEVLVRRAAVPAAARAAEALRTADDEEREWSRRREQSRELMQLLELRAGALASALPKEHPEGIANAMTEYLHGTVDTLARAAPELTTAMAEEIEQAICTPTQKSDALTMVYLRAMRSLPDLASEKTFDCFFQQHQQEDVVLWEAMDALRASDVTPPSAWAELAQRAVEPETRFRLRSDEEQEREKLSAANQPAERPTISSAEDLLRIASHPR